VNVVLLLLQVLRMLLLLQVQLPLEDDLSRPRPPPLEEED